MTDRGTRLELIKQTDDFDAFVLETLRSAARATHADEERIKAALDRCKATVNPALVRSCTTSSPKRELARALRQPTNGVRRYRRTFQLEARVRRIVNELSEQEGGALTKAQVRARSIKWVEIIEQLLRRKKIL